MTPRAPFLLTLALAALTMSAPSDARAQAPGLPDTGFQIGEPFPTLALPSLDDRKPTSISDFRGQKLILHVFASW